MQKCKKWSHEGIPTQPQRYPQAQAAAEGEAKTAPEVKAKAAAEAEAKAAAEVAKVATEAKSMGTSEVKA